MRGRIVRTEEARSFGFISSGGRQIFFHRSGLIEPDLMPAIDALVEFEIVEGERGPQAQNITVIDAEAAEVTEGAVRAGDDHARHCFVVMPYGRDAHEVRWHRGWYETVIAPAVVEAGFEPILAATEERPNAINDEIRTHLALDPMVVIDLGGAAAHDPPNPNVMYELGIRHALGLPLVMMGWADQSLPFDISNQRVIMEQRELLDLQPTREKLVTFIEAAREGHYYRPMEAVGRIAAIDVATESLGQHSILGVLAREVRDLRRAVSRTSSPQVGRVQRAFPGPKKKKVRQFAHLLTKDEKTRLREAFDEAGGDSQQWSAVLGTRLSDIKGDDPAGWTEEDWLDVVREAARNGKVRLDRRSEVDAKDDEDDAVTVAEMPHELDDDPEVV